MEKRYQVFVSSTYQDLIQERIEVMQALLELDCIPCGMEYFPAADETQWDFIKRLIDESDYYIVIIAGKYGSVDDSGVSYTQKEYEYAISKGIPTIGFIHRDPDSLISSKTEKDKNTITKLEKFKELVKKKLCKFWMTPQELGAVVSRSISQAKKNYPRTGWVKADTFSETSEKEILQLYKKIELLEKKLAETSEFTDAKVEDLASENDTVKIIIDIHTGKWDNRKVERKVFEMTWNTIAYHLLPKLSNSVRENTFKVGTNTVVREAYLTLYSHLKFDSNTSINVTPEFYETIKIQFQLLDFIRIIDEEVVKDGKSATVKKVHLTSKGKQKLIDLRAVKKNLDITTPYSVS